MSTYPVNVDQAGQSAPLTYSPPDIAEVEAIAAFARYDGTAAASAFLPSLAFYSDGGLLLARVFPSDQVEAGDAADVTFGPFLGDGGGLRRFAVARVGTGGTSTVAAFDTVRLDFASFTTTDPAVFATGNYASGVINNAAGDDGLFLRKRGLYLASVSYVPAIGVALEDFEGLIWDGQPPATPSISGYARSALGVETALQTGMAILDSVHEDDPVDDWRGSLTVINRTAGAIDIDGASMTVYFLPLRSSAFTTVY